MNSLEARLIKPLGKPQKKGLQMVTVCLPRKAGCHPQSPFLVLTVSGWQCLTNKFGMIQTNHCLLDGLKSSVIAAEYPSEIPMALADDCCMIFLQSMKSAHEFCSQRYYRIYHDISDMFDKLIEKVQVCVCLPRFHLLNRLPKKNTRPPYHISC